MGRRAKATVHRYESDENHLLLEGSHDGYTRLSGAPIHRRLIQATADRLEIQDTVEGGDGQAVESRVLFHPSFRVEQNENRIRLFNGEISIEIRSSAPVKVTSAWWCPDFNVAQEAVQLVLAYGTAPCKGDFILERRLSEERDTDALHEGTFTL